MKRRLARAIAVQSLYHMEMNDSGVEAAISMAINETKAENSDDAENNEPIPEYLRGLVVETWGKKAVLDDLLSGYLKGWKLERLSKVDRQILRVAAYEMLYGKDVPPKAAINEAIELAKHFGDDESGKFVNGVLGNMLKDLDAIKEKINA
ncbi:MAG TPA: transcription antitermination factor NusB [Bacilli bacterium]